jgi:2-oxo-4-hydroxy-4-carboxy-5-ureidoimidazoline decarboxylase
MKSVQDINILKKTEFVSYFQNIFEKTKWIAEKMHTQKPFKNKQNIFTTAITIFNCATKKQILKILQAHPDLAVKQKLTKESTREQKNAKLNECTPKEFNEFQQLNKEYKQKFGFPFIIAVKGKSKTIILDSFKKRINNSLDKEFMTAKQQVEKIASFRLKDLVK